MGEVPLYPVKVPCGMKVISCLSLPLLRFREFCNPREHTVAFFFFFFLLSGLELSDTKSYAFALQSMYVRGTNLELRSAIWDMERISWYPPQIGVPCALVVPLWEGYQESKRR